MYDKNLLITDKLPPLSDRHIECISHASSVYPDCNRDYNEWLERASAWLMTSKHRTITGLDSFSHRHVIMGCNHFIDNLLIKHGQLGVQIFQHDYGYYGKLLPNRPWATLDTLQPSVPLLMAMPFPGHLSVHKEMAQILDRCDELDIPVHLDGAWLPASFDIEFDFNRSCIQSFATSFSKAVDLGWSRIGVRWSKTLEDDNIRLFNDSKMIPMATLGIADYYMDNLHVDYFIDEYKVKYMDVCKQLRLRPTNIIHAAMSINRQELYGLKNLLTS